MALDIFDVYGVTHHDGLGTNGFLGQALAGNDLAVATVDPVDVTVEIAHDRVLALSGRTGEPAILQIALLPDIGAGGLVESEHLGIVVDPVDAVLVHVQRGEGREAVVPQRATAGAVDRGQLAVIGSAVDGRTVEDERAVRIGEAVDLGTAFAGGEGLFPELLAVIEADGRELAGIGAHEHDAIGDEQAAVATQAQQRNHRLVVGPATLAGLGIDAVDATVVAADHDEVADDDRRGDDFRGDLGGPATLAVLRIDAVQMAVERADGDEVTRGARTTRETGIFALGIAPAEPAV